MHALAPLVIIFGIMAVILGLFWVISADTETNDAPDIGMTFIFGGYYLAMRVLRALFTEPMSVLPGFGFIIAGAGLIWLGVWML